VTRKVSGVAIAGVAGATVDVTMLVALLVAVPRPPARGKRWCCSASPPSAPARPSQLLFGAAEILSSRYGVPRDHHVGHVSPVRIGAITARVANYSSCMAESSIFTGILAAAALRMRADLAASALVRHNPSKGTVREGDLLDFLTPYLPETVRAAGSSEIISTDGQTSGQMDIVIYDPAAPPLFSRNGYRILPIECVYAVIEVKSKLTWAELSKSTEAIAKVKQMPKAAFVKVPLALTCELYGEKYEGYTPVHGFVFGYDSSDLLTMSDDYLKKLREIPYDQRIDAVWTLGKGSYTWYSQSEKTPYMHAGPEFDLAVSPPDADMDVLLHMVLIISGLMSRSFMLPFDIAPYLKDDGITDNATIRGPVSYCIAEDTAP
jgi:hypothetical protein